MARVPGWLKVLVPASVLVGTIAIGISSAGRADRNRVLKDEWGQLLSCLAQGSEPLDATQLAARVRAVELHYATSVDARRGRQLRREWLSKCGIRATHVHEMARAMEGDRGVRLGDAMDELADSLRAGRRPTRDAIRDVLEAGAAFGLDMKGLPAPQPGPVKGKEPRLSFADTAPRPLAESALSLTGWDPVPDLDAHFLLEAAGEGDATRLACFATKSGDDLLGSVQCTRVPDGAEGTGMRFEGVAGTKTHALAFVDKGKVSFHTWQDGRWTAAGFATGDLATFVGSEGRPAAVVQRVEGQIDLLALGEIGGAKRVQAVKDPAWAIAVGGELVWATMATAALRGRVMAAPIGRITEASSGSVVGERIEQGVPLACEDGPTRALLVDRPRPGGSSAVSRSAELFLAREGRWTQVPIVPSWTTRPTVAVAFPRTPVLDCWRDDAVLTWADGDDQDRLRQTRCSQKGCRSKVAYLGSGGRDLLHADLGERVLLVWNDAEHHIVRLRLAPFEELATTADDVLVDYDDDTNDPAPVRAQHIITRDDSSLVLLRVERKDKTQLVAVRVDARGRVRFPDVITTP
jgi:hypothetical protein